MLNPIFLFLIAFLVGADEFLLGPILTPISADLSVSPEHVALFITAYGLPLAILAPILGGISDRYGRLSVLIPAVCIFGLASMATALAPTFATGIAARILTGTASGGMLGIAMAMAGDLGEKDAPKAIAFVTSGLTLGIILSPGIGAMSAAFWSWRLAFAGLGALAIIIGVACLLSRHAISAPTLQPPSPCTIDGNNVKEQLFVPGVWASLIAMTTGLGGAVGCFALVGERLRSLFEWDTAMVGAIYMAFGALTLAGNLIMPWALARIGSGRALMRIAMVGVLASIVVVFALGAVGPTFFLIALAIWAVLGGIGAPGLQTHIAGLSSPRRGTLMALAGSGMNLGVALAAALAGRAYQAGAAWVAMVALVFLATAIAALRRPAVNEPQTAMGPRL